VTTREALQTTLRLLVERLSREEERAAAEEEGRRRFFNEVRSALTTLCRISNSEGPVQTARKPYVVHDNGRRRAAMEADITDLRQNWDGHFLLDLPGCVLRVRTPDSTKDILLRPGNPHRGAVNVLIVGMSKPGWVFGHRDIPRLYLTEIDLSLAALKKYVHIVRRLIGDSGKKPKYLLRAEADISRSRTERGYRFNDEYRYVVIRRSSEET